MVRVEIILSSKKQPIVHCAEFGSEEYNCESVPRHHLFFKDDKDQDYAISNIIYTSLNQLWV